MIERFSNHENERKRRRKGDCDTVPHASRDHEKLGRRSLRALASVPLRLGLFFIELKARSFLFLVHGVAGAALRDRSTYAERSIVKAA